MQYPLVVMVAACEDGSHVGVTRRPRGSSFLPHSLAFEGGPLGILSKQLQISRTRRKGELEHNQIRPLHGKGLREFYNSGTNAVLRQLDENCIVHC